MACYTNTTHIRARDVRDISIDVRVIRARSSIRAPRRRHRSRCDATALRDLESRERNPRIIYARPVPRRPHANVS